ncbi:AA-permease domain-containing protein [Mycena indigotica]|uniref:AA-permease domain-containing protein n=1 Tax=Mycena indigotica TaxID=2126181 RepID=A0A8H6S4U5_9AGAR|nr:AA-permease domain-containing protein [Mycena indigotica]KAF7292783.1 AA-permease domain-containing protein [Mycena indigotica]
MSSSPDYDIEKKASHSNDHVVTEDVVHGGEGGAHMHRSLKGRQVSMIAIAGTIGTGLFLGSGRALANGGPVGALLGYGFVGMLVGLMMYSLGEMMVWDPSAGGFIEFATRYVDPAMGFAMGWQFWFQAVMTAPVEIVAASIVISFWDHNDDHKAIYIAVMTLGIVLVNLAGVKYFGEFEFVFAFIKIITVIGLIIACLVIDLGGAPDKDRRGFRYWRDEPFNNHFFQVVPASKARFLGFWAVLTQAAFSYGGMEGLAMICLEAANPRVSMRTAVRAIFYRIVLLYVFAILLIGMCLSRSDPRLLQANAEGSGTAAQSPFVIIIQNAGIKALPHIINAVVLTSAFSSGNEFLYSSSRGLFMLAQEGKAPRILAKVAKNGVPIYSLAVCSLFSLLGFLACGKEGANDAFNWLANITTLGSMITWCGVALSHTRWYRAMKVQGMSREELPFRSWTQPYGAWAVLISFSIIIFFNGYTTFMTKPFDYQSFISSYINIPFFIILFIGWKISHKTKWVSLSEMDCSTHYVEDSVVYSKY